MSEKTYNIVITGALVEGASRQSAMVAFAQLTKLDESKAQAIFDAAPKVIKSGVDAEKAKALLKTLKKIGVEATAKLQAPEQNQNSQPQPQPQSQPNPGPAADASQERSNSNTSFATKSVYEPANPQGWSFKIEGKPDYSFLTVQVPADETLKVEASAMAAMDTHIKMKTKLRGGFGRFLTGENLFINDFTAQQVPGEVAIAPATPGDIYHQYLNGDTIFLQNSAYVASTAGVEVETKWQGLVKGFFSGESLFLIRCSGQGDLWFNTYGAIIEIDVTDDYVVDTGNIVAFTEGLDYKITKVGGYKSLFFSGEGLVCRFSGQGKVWIQTRSAAAFTSWAHWFRPVKKSN